MAYSMKKPIPLVNMEQNKKFDDALVQRLAKIIEVLSNLEQ
jgi:hypothetical protein